MNKKLLTMITTGAIAISNMGFAFAEIPNGGVPKGETPVFDEGEPGDDILDDVISGEEYEESEADDSMDEEPSEDEPIIDEAEMERLEREEHEKELAEKEEVDDDIMDEIEKDVEKYDKEEEDVIGGIDDDYYDVGEEPEIKDEDPAENIPDENDEKSNNKEVVSNENNSNNNLSNNTAGAISQDKEVEHKVVTNAGDTKVDEDKVVKELDEPQGKGNSSGNPKTGDMGIIGSIIGMVTAVGGIIFARKKL